MMALDAADRVHRENQPKSQALAEAMTSMSPAPGQGTADQIRGVREKQMEEVDLLTDHYCALLRSQGENYETLVRNAYGTSQNYAVFLLRLEEAEKAVNQAAIRDLSSQVENLPNAISKMEQALALVRTQEAQRIFPRPAVSVPVKS
jgi:hypothetical protein